VQDQKWQKWGLREGEGVAIEKAVHPFNGSFMLCLYGPTPEGKPT